MSSKALMFLGLLLAMFLVISSQVTARELAEKASKFLDTSKEAEKNKVAVNDAKYYGPEDNGNGGGGPSGYASLIPPQIPGGNPGGGGGYCQYVCCGYSSGSCSCCKFAGEKVDGQPQN